MRKATIFVILMFLFVLCAIPAHADGIPALPHAFYGNVTINGSAAPVGTLVEARGEGVLTGIEDNPVVTTVAGIYGTSNPFEHRLIVQGNILDGATLSFYVNGVPTGQTAVWHSGELTRLDIALSIAAPPPPTIETSFFGTATTITIDSSGIVQETVEFTSPSGEVTITIPEGTMALDEEGEPLTELTAETSENPPPPPEDTTVIGLSYDFGPDGATFNPPLSLTFTYDPDTLPEGVSAEDLVIAFYDTAAGEWVTLVSVVNTETNTITASVSHFCCFSLVATTPPEIEEEPPVVIVEEKPPVVEEEEPPVVEEEEPPVVEEEEPPVVEEEEPPVVEEEEPLVVEEPSGLNWPVIGGIIGGVLLVAAALGYLWYRRRAYS